MAHGMTDKPSMLPLFAEDPTHNHLPRDGSVHYWGSIFSHSTADQLTQRLLHELNWQNDEAIIYGKHIITRRQYAWHADRAYEYTYSGISRRAQPWTALTAQLKQIVESKTRQTYNACLLNLYPDGDTGMAWHSDDEKDLLQHGSIASLSLGAQRKFSLKHIASGEKIDFLLNSGDLLEMCGSTQSHWQHCLPKSKKVTSPRINLTFRQMR